MRQFPAEPLPWDNEPPPFHPAPTRAPAAKAPRPRRSARARVLGWSLRVLGLLAFLAVVGLWAVTLRPTFLAGPATYITVSGRSMEPTLNSGDLVILRAHDSYEAGDVVAYRIRDGEPGAGNRIIHRIVGGTGSEGYVTRGDNRDSEDQWRPTDDEVLGELWIRMPGVGEKLPLLRAPIIVATLAALLAVWLVFDWWKQPRDEEAS